MRLRELKVRATRALAALTGDDRFHFVSDYKRLVRNLKRKHPIDEAMSLAVGGHYELIGQIEAALLRRVGLKNGMRVVDLGCGSGRLATVLAKTAEIYYVGIDIIPDLLSYAKSKVPGYEFICHQELNIPQPSQSVDIICAFSIFTHLLMAETYLYLEECKRVIKSDGIIVFSFLEFSQPIHWKIFMETVRGTKSNSLGHLNIFLERSSINIWAKSLGLDVVEFVEPSFPIWSEHGFGQSLVVLRNSAGLS